MKLVYNNKTEEDNIVLHQHSAVFNLGTINSATSISATLKNAISNSKRLNQCNIEKFQHLIVKYSIATILNSATITIAITTSGTTVRAI